MIQREVKRAATLTALAAAIPTTAQRLARIGRNEAGALASADAAIEQLQGADAWIPPLPPSSGCDGNLAMSQRTPTASTPTARTEA